MHIGVVQVVTKPMCKLGLNNAILLTYWDGRQNQIQESILGAIEANISKGPIYFNYSPNMTISFSKAYNLLVVLNTKFHGYNMKPRSIHALVIYRI